MLGIMSDASLAATWIAVIGTLAGALIGAIAVFGAQLMAGRRETARLASEERRHTQTLFFESKRVAFSTVIALVDERRVTMQEGLVADWADNTTRQYPDATWFQRWRTVRGEISLLDGTITAPMQILLDLFAEWSNEIGFDYIEHGLEHAAAIQHARDDLLDAMEQSIGVTEYGFLDQTP